MIGTALVNELSNTDISIDLLDINPPDIEPASNLHYTNCDITTDSGLELAGAKAANANVLFFKAGVLGNALKAAYPDFAQTYFDVNFYSLLNIMERCEENPPGHVLIDSSIAAVATKDMAEAATESNEFFQPMNFYGLSKLALEQFAQYIQQQTGIKVTVFRYPRVHSPGYKNVIWHFMSSVINNHAITLTGDPEKLIDFVHIDEVVDATLRAITMDREFEILHVTAGEPIKLVDLAKKIISKYGTKGHSINIKEDAVVPLEPAVNCLDDSYTRKILNMGNPISLDQMIEQTYQLLVEKI